MLPILVALAMSQPAFAPAAFAGTREDGNGWIVVHLKGNPHEVGFQHGSLLAPEIADSVKTCGAVMSIETGQDWTWYRETAMKLFWPKLDKEYQDEISGIAEGAKSKGDAVDAADILALNSYIELSDYYLPKLRAEEGHAQILSGAPSSCSAFVATGSETKDGKIVMAHNFWWDYVMGERWRLVLDITPSKGHRVMFDALPGLIDSGSDWAINDQGIALCETTISDFTGFDENGVPEFERMRKAIQYSDDLDDVAHTFKQGNNGGYANTWLLADMKTNEIGKLELGLKNVIFSTSTDGYYVGSNFPEDPKLMKEEAPGYNNKGGNCEMRKARWISHLEQDRGKVDADLAMSYMADSMDEGDGKPDGGGSALCGKSPFGGAINAKVTTSDMLKKMQFWGRMGIPDGTDLIASDVLQGSFGDQLRPYLKDFKAQPWTIISKN